MTMNFKQIFNRVAFAFLTTLTIASVSAFAAPTRHFKITMTGFTVDRQTTDGETPPERNGDEVVNATNSFNLNFPSKTVNWAPPFGLSTSSALNFRTGDFYPNKAPWQLDTRPTIVTGAPAPRYIFDGDITYGQNAVVVVPVLLEADYGDYSGAVRLDGDTRVEGELWNACQSEIQAKGTDILSIGRGLATSDDANFRSDRFDSLGGFGSTLFDVLLKKPLTRPVGMREAGGGKANFRPQFLIFNYQTASAAAVADEGHGAGVISVKYEDDARLGGAYTIYFKIQIV